MDTSTIRQFLTSFRFWFWVIAVTAALAVFQEPLTTGLSIWGPDSSNFGHIQHRRSLPGAYLGGWNDQNGLGMATSSQPMNPYHLVKFLVPGSHIRPAIYIASILGSILAGMYWFRGLGLGRWPSYLGSLALGFTAHTFTLMSAGHDGKTLSWPFCILLLAATHRALTRKSFFNFMLAGYSAGMCYSLQPDLAMLLTFLTGAYALFLFLRHWPRPAHSSVSGGAAPTSPSPATPQSASISSERIRYIACCTLGTLLAGAMITCLSLSSITFALRVVLPDRQALASATGTSGDSKKNEWEFATNWSLPPDEVLEMVAPCFFGIQTGDPRGPYWGSLGRTLGWKEHHKGLMNLRQHTVYIGVIQLVFAALAVATVLRRRKPAYDEIQPADCAGDRQLTAEHRAEILFWAGALIVALLLAFGRNFPLYRLFYMLPVASSLRAPVKFVHLVEISVAILLAFGMQAWWSYSRAVNAKQPAPDAKQKKGNRAPAPATESGPSQMGLLRAFGFACIALGVLFLFGLAVVNAQADTLRQTWAAMGMSNYATVLLDLANTSLLRAAGIFMVCAGALLATSYFASPRAWQASSAILLLVLAADLGSVDKRYITVWDEYARYTPSELVASLKSTSAHTRVSLPVRGGIYDLWRQYSLPHNWITLLDGEDPRSMSEQDKAFFTALRNHPTRLWQLTSTADVMGPAEQLMPVAKSQGVSIQATFDITNEGSVRWAKENRGAHVWLRVAGALPRAAIYGTVEHLDEQSVAMRLSDPNWNPARSVLVTGTSTNLKGEDTPLSPADITSYTPNRIEIASRSDKGGILMLNDRYDARWEVFLDDNPTPLLRCNGVMRGVEVPSGAHKIVFLYRPDWPYFAANCAGTLSLIVCGILTTWTRRRKISPPGQEG